MLNAQKPPFSQGATLQTLSRMPASGGTSSTSMQVTGRTQTLTDTFLIGSANILIGVNLMTPFFVPTGGQNTDVRTNNEINQMVTTTLSGGNPTVETLLQQRIITLDLGAVVTARESGLPLVLSLRESLVNAHSGGIGDVNDGIFRQWLGPNDTDPQGDKGTPEQAPSSGDAHFFASGNAGFLSQNGSAATAGLRDTRESGTVGAEWKVSPKFRIGLAATYGSSDVWQQRRMAAATRIFPAGLGRSTLTARR